MQKRRLYVPVFAHLFWKYKEQYLQDLKDCGADRVFLAVGFPILPQEREDMMDFTRKSLPILQDAGFDPCVWINAFGFGTPLRSEEKEITKDFTKITDLQGRTLDSAFCPTDSAFLQYYTDFVQKLIRAGAKAILLDDDLCLNVRPGIGCLCDEHLRRLGVEMGRPVTREEIAKTVFTGEATEARAAWCKVMGDSLREFCRAVRRAADEIDPAVRIGFCAGYTSWDEECADPTELTRILAGNNAPFLRYTAAPYWEYGNRFPWQPESHIAEFARQQMEWCKDVEDTDLFTENDSFPRPCSNVPAFAMESFDFMTAAAGNPNQLKYLFDYVSSPQYERGYLQAHKRNEALIRDTAETLAPLTDGGIFVYEPKNKLKQISFPETFSNQKQIMRSLSFSAASALLCANGIPVTYRERGSLVATFGAGGQTVDLTKKAYILDATAALELQKRGIDVGILQTEPADLTNTEYFLRDDDSVRISDTDCGGILRAILSPAAKIESRLSERVPLSYRYKNAAGTDFLVFLFRGDFIDCTKELSCSYYRRKQILRFCEDTQNPLPVYPPKHHGLHVICKDSETHLGVAYCNYSNDPVYDPLFRCSATAVEKTFRCNARMVAEGLRTEEIPPRSFGAFLLKK